MNPTRNLIVAIMAIGLLCNACKKNSTPAPPKSTETGCLINSFSSGTEYKGSIIYNADKTINEVKIVQTDNANIDDQYSYSGNTLTILSSIAYFNGTTQITTSSITQNNSGQITGIKTSTDNGMEGYIYSFTYSGQNVSSATTSRFVGTNISPPGTVTYNYDSNGNLLSLLDNSSGQKLINFSYDSTLPAKQGDLFWYDQISYGENTQLLAFLYPVQNKNLCSGAPAFAPATFTYDDNKNISTMSLANTIYKYGYNCGN